MPHLPTLVVDGIFVFAGLFIMAVPTLFQFAKLTIFGGREGMYHSPMWEGLGLQSPSLGRQSGLDCLTFLCRPIWLEVCCFGTSFGADPGIGLASGAVPGHCLSLGAVPVAHSGQ